MIWPEYRMHSIIFAWRHVLGTFATVLNLWPSGLAARIAAKYGLVLATMSAADLATRKLGNAAKRTTNAMPYPDWLSAEMRLPIKDRYVSAQFAATAMATYSRDDGYTAFIPLIGIQSAAFCMTLIRKRKMTARGLHLIYFFSLLLAGPWTLLYWALTREDDHFGYAAIIGMGLVMRLRLQAPIRIPKELLWLLGVILLETGFFLSRDVSPVDVVSSPFLSVVMNAVGVVQKLGMILLSPLVIFVIFCQYSAPFSILVFGPDSVVVRSILCFF